MSTESAGTVATTGPKNPVKALLESESSKKAIAAICAKHLNPERLTRVVLTACNRNPKLLECTRESLWQAVMDCAALGLEPDALGRAYLIPFEKKKQVDGQWVTDKVLCQLVIGYKGRADLIYRSGLVESIQAQVVYSGDRFEFDYGINEKLSHCPALGERGTPIGAYAYAKIKGGGFKMDWMTVADINRIRDRSNGWQQAVRAAERYKKPVNSPWASDWDEMAKKTVFNRLSKMLPMSSELADNIERADRAELPEQMPDLGGGEPATVETSAERVEADAANQAPAPATGEQPTTAAPAPAGNPFAKKGGAA
jgi:recombination protein RecT